MKSKKNNDISILNSKSKSWIKPLYTLFFVAIPAFFIWFFLGNDFREKSPLSFGFNWLVAISFLAVIIITTFLLVYLKVLNMSIMTFVIPIAICFMAIYLSSWLKASDSWYRILIIIPLVFLVIPINILVNNYERKQIIKLKIRNEIANKK